MTDSQGSSNSLCPFCGGTVDPTGWMGNDSRGNRIQGPECNDCGATAPSLEVWNKRHAHEPRARLDADVSQDEAWRRLHPPSCYIHQGKLCDCHVGHAERRAAQPPKACCHDAPEGMHHPRCLNIGSPATRESQPPAPALRPDGMPEPSLDVLKRVATRMRTDAPDSAYLVEWAAEQIEALLAIARAARNVCAYDWSDNDDDAVATMDRLHAVVGPWLARSTPTKGEGQS